MIPRYKEISGCSIMYETLDGPWVRYVDIQHLLPTPPHKFEPESGTEWCAVCGDSILDHD